ncbi:MAG: hypothetical protein EB127_03505 [Alphaproteobacteria bacterium]|nr:hypothetical protein [Alphaproteobacteria bacterium]
MPDIIQDLADVIPSDLRKQVQEELLHGWRLQEVEARKEAKKLAAFGHANPAKAIEGVGQLVARIPPAAFHYWGIRLGYECWEDKQFMKDFLKHNPEVAVKNRVKRTMVGGAKGIFDANGFIVK